MSETEVKKYGVDAKVAVLAVGVALYLGNIVTPLIGSIAKEYPNENQDLVRLITTMPQFATMLMALSMTWLESKFPRRTLAIAACFFLVGGGMAPMWLNGVVPILISRAVFGIGLGISFPLASGMIGEMFDGAERQQMLGLRQSCGTAAGFVFSLATGFIATINWRYSFYLMLFGLVILAVVIFKLPEPERKPKVISATGVVEKPKLTPMTWFIVAMNCGYNVLLLSYSVNMSMVVVVGNIGTVADAGIVSGCYTALAFLAGLSYPKIEQVLKRYTVALAVGCVGAGLTVLLFSTQIMFFFVGAGILGFGFGLYNPCVTLKVIKSVDRSASTKAVSVYIVSQAGAQFLSPLVFMALTALFGITGLKASWTVAVPVLIVATLGIILFVAFTKTKEQKAAAISQ